MSKFVSDHIVKCPSCGADALDHMTKCPKCGAALVPAGYKEMNPSLRKKIRIVLTVIFSFIAFAVALYLLLR